MCAGRAADIPPPWQQQYGPASSPRPSLLGPAEQEAGARRARDPLEGSLPPPPLPPSSAGSTKLKLFSNPIVVDPPWPGTT